MPTLVGELRNPVGGAPVVGYLRIVPSTQVSHMVNNVGYVVQPVEVPIDVDGLFAVPLVGVDDVNLTAQGWVYHASVISSGRIVARKTFQVFVAQNSVDWSTLTDAVPDVQFVSGVTLAEVTALLTGYMLHSDTVVEAVNYGLNRPSPLANPGTASDMFRYTFGGVRGAYVNEKACYRARDPAGDQYAFRAQCHSSNNGTPQPIGSFATADNVDQFVTLANGDSAATRDMYVGGAINFGTLQAPGDTFDTPGSWVALTYNNGASSVGSPYYDGSYQLRSFREVFLRGRISTAPGSVGNYVADAALFTLPVGLRPARSVVFPCRSTGTGATNGNFTIASNGQGSFSQGITLTGAQVATFDIGVIRFTTDAN